jgi:hypothetical protein
MLKNANSIIKITSLGGEATSRSFCQNFPPSMEPGGSLLCSHDEASDHYPEADNPRHNILSSLFMISLTLHSHLQLGFPSGLFSSCSAIIFFLKFPSLLRVSRASFVLLYIVLSPLRYFVNNTDYTATCDTVYSISCVSFILNL